VTLVEIRPRGLDLDVAGAAAELDGAPAEEVVAWAMAGFGPRLAIAASMTDAVLIDVASRVAPGIEVIFLDTQYHFQETLATAEVVRDRYPIRLRVVWPEPRPDDLWRTDPDACCHARKVLPMERALQGREAWLSGLRRADSPLRAAVPVVERDRRGLVKVNPLASWTDEDVAAYIAAHDVPVNPLLAQGYPSIGCWPCTRPVAEGEDGRAGRWSGHAKAECGLHR
jgi:phosphoadenosine phosphosulfate reductase